MALTVEQRINAYRFVMGLIINYTEFYVCPGLYKWMSMNGISLLLTMQEMRDPVLVTKSVLEFFPEFASKRPQDLSKKKYLVEYRSAGQNKTDSNPHSLYP